MIIKGEGAGTMGVVSPWWGGGRNSFLAWFLMESGVMPVVAHFIVA